MDMDWDDDSDFGLGSLISEDAEIAMRDDRELVFTAKRDDFSGCELAKGD
jgi:hypothetical protein